VVLDRPATIALSSPQWLGAEPRERSLRGTVLTVAGKLVMSYVEDNERRIGEMKGAQLYVTDRQSL
jgi:hypothetical protein